MTNRVYKLKQELKDIEETVKSLRYTQAVIITDMPKGTGISDETAQKAEKIIDNYTKRYNELLDKIEEEYEMQKALTDAIASLTPDEQKVIKKRYVDGIKWDYIPAHVNMARGHCFRVHDRAMYKLLTLIR